MKELLKGIIYKSIWRTVKGSFLVSLPYLLLFLFSITIILSIFGAAPEEADPGREKVREYVSDQKFAVESKYGQEKEFAVPWGLVYAVEEYANGWSVKPDMERVKRVYEMLLPVFCYEEYEETFVTTYSYIDKDGQEHTDTETRKLKVKLLTQVATYEGVHLFDYVEATESEGETLHTYMKPVGRRFARDYSRLDCVLASELGSRSYATVTVAGGELFWPVPSSRTVSSPFGMRIHPLTGRYGRHTGIDIAAAEGSDVVAAADGVVRAVEDDDIYGKMIIIDHGEGFFTMYAHNSFVAIKSGDIASRGMKIAEVGNTGMSSGPHLHFELRKDGVFLDPLSGVKAPEGVSVAIFDNVDRKIVLETADAFIKGQAGLEWLNRTWKGM